jgi:hypothetical protein
MANIKAGQRNKWPEAKGLLHYVCYLQETCQPFSLRYEFLILWSQSAHVLTYTNATHDLCIIVDGVSALTTRFVLNVD